MNEQTPTHDYLLFSRGQWDKGTSKADIEAAIEKFYAWYDGHLKSGQFKRGSRLTTDGATVSKSGVTTDGPFGEAKEVIGGYWIIVARSLREAAEIAAQSPCLACGLRYEIRPLETERGSAYRHTNESPTS